MTENAMRVQAGAKWLDEVHPGWLEKIDLDVLDIGDGWNCILGQLEGDFDVATGQMGLSFDELVSYGLLPEEIAGWERVADSLTDEWRKLINARTA